MTDFKNRLKRMKEAWGSSKDQYDSMFGGAKIPAAEYMAKLQNVTLREQSNGLVLAREHVITEGQYEGTVIFDNMNLETPMGFTYCRRWIEQMGYEAPEEPEDLPEVVETILGEEPIVQIKLAHNKAKSGDIFPNVRIIKLLTEEPGGDDTPDDGEGDEECPDCQTALEPGATKCTNCGIEFEEDTPGDDTPEDKEGEELRNQMLTFCATWDIDADENDDYDALHDKIAERVYPEEETDEEERTLLETIGLSKCIEKKKAPPKTVKKAAKKTAKAGKKKVVKKKKR